MEMCSYWEVEGRFPVVSARNPRAGHCLHPAPWRPIWIFFFFNFFLLCFLGRIVLVISILDQKHESALVQILSLMGLTSLSPTKCPKYSGSLPCDSTVTLLGSLAWRQKLEGEICIPSFSTLHSFVLLHSPWFVRAVSEFEHKDRHGGSRL